MNSLLGFTPDADPITPGVITDCDNIVPTNIGLTVGPTPIQSTAPTLPAPCIGASVVTRLDGTRRIIAGTQTNLYELSGTWSSVGSGYTGEAETRWVITQFGDSILATNLADTIQRSNISGAFTSIASAPKAKIIYSVGAFVMALHTNDGTLKQDGWHNCASFDDTDWTPNVATLANKGRLVSTTGEITAGGRLGEFAIAYKERAIYVGQFVGAPVTFDWVQVAGTAGCVGLDAWCDVEGAHFLVGPDNFWLFDGSRPVPIAENQIRMWFFNNSNPSYRYKTQCVYDKQNNRVWTFFCRGTSSTLNSALVYHLLTKQWGLVTINVQSVLNFTQPALTIDQLNTLSATFDGFPNIPFDSQFWKTGGKSLALFNTSNNLMSYTGTGGTGYFITGDLGDDDAVTTVNKVRVRFQENPTSATIVMYSKMNEGDNLTAQDSTAMVNNQFDVRQTARFHRAKITLNGGAKFNAIRVTTAQSGER